MPRYNVEWKGKWAHYSGIADGFLTRFMDLKEYEEWRTLEYGQDKEPLETANKQSFHECVDYMKIVRGRKHVIMELMEALGINKKQAKNLVKRSRRKNKSYE